MRGFPRRGFAIDKRVDLGARQRALEHGEHRRGKQDVPMMAKLPFWGTKVAPLELPSPQSMLTDKFEPSAAALGSVSVTVPTMNVNCWPGRKCSRRAVRIKGKSSATRDVATALLPPTSWMAIVAV